MNDVITPSSAELKAPVADAISTMEAELDSYFDNIRKNGKKYVKALHSIFINPRSFVVKSGWLESVALHQPIKNGEIIPKPWFNYGFVSFLERRVRPDMAVFEYGAGYSTLWWQNQVSKVFSVDNDLNWVNHLKEEISANVDLRFIAVETGGLYCQAARDIDILFDVIVVDGRDRVNCAKVAVEKLKPDGVIIFDNSQRDYYREGIEEIKSKGFKEIQFSGIASMTYVESFTSILYKADNCFQI